eukprot:1649610-Rhodomonas_salina.3
MSARAARSRLLGSPAPLHRGWCPPRAPRPRRAGTTRRRARGASCWSGCGARLAGAGRGCGRRSGGAGRGGGGRARARPAPTPAPCGSGPGAARALARTAGRRSRQGGSARAPTSAAARPRSPRPRASGSGGTSGCRGPRRCRSRRSARRRRSTAATSGAGSGCSRGTRCARAAAAARCPRASAASRACALPAPTPSTPLASTASTPPRPTPRTRRPPSSSTTAAQPQHWTEPRGGGLRAGRRLTVALGADEAREAVEVDALAVDPAPRAVLALAPPLELRALGRTLVPALLAVRRWHPLARLLHDRRELQDRLVRARLGRDGGPQLAVLVLVREDQLLCLFLPGVDRPEHKHARENVKVSCPTRHTRLSAAPMPTLDQPAAGQRTDVQPLELLARAVPIQLLQEEHGDVFRSRQQQDPGHIAFGTVKQVCDDHHNQGVHPLVRKALVQVLVVHDRSDRARGPQHKDQRLHAPRGGPVRLGRTLGPPRHARPAAPRQSQAGWRMSCESRVRGVVGGGAPA